MAMGKKWIGLFCIVLLVLAGSGCFRLHVQENKEKKVITGLEKVLGNPEDFQGKRVGLIANPTSITPDYQHALDAMLARGIQVTKVFGPEHGVRGSEQAGEEPDTAVDPKTGIPFENLYGKKPEEMASLFQEVDVLVFDMQETGTRFYTYLYTMADAMKAAGMLKKPFYVLDRPNPLGGTRVEGPLLNPAFRSSVGRFPIPLVHGMTIGELAHWINDQQSPKAELHVVKMEGWTRDQRYEDTGLPWVMPSPNIPSPLTALVYPGTGLVEGTNLSEGRGTTRPFELVGAPYVNGWELAQALNRARLPGVVFREAYFIPSFSKYQGEEVGGVQIHVTDVDQFDPVLTGITILEKTKKLYPEQFAWVRSGEKYWIDLLTGTDQIRRQLDQGKSAREIIRQWKKEINHFQGIRKKYLLYSS
jgi:uncharacterized protein YbbC (DUF1343 family)